MKTWTIECDFCGEDFPFPPPTKEQKELGYRHICEVIDPDKSSVCPDCYKRIHPSKDNGMK